MSKFKSRCHCRYHLFFVIIDSMTTKKKKKKKKSKTKNLNDNYREDNKTLYKLNESISYINRYVIFLSD